MRRSIRSKNTGIVSFDFGKEYSPNRRPFGYPFDFPFGFAQGFG